MSRGQRLEPGVLYDGTAVVGWLLGSVGAARGAWRHQQRHVEQVETLH